MNKIKRFYQNSRFPFLCLFLVLLIYHIFIDGVSGDEANYFSIVLDDSTVGEFLVTRYYGWTSRLIIEIGIIFLSRWYIWIWKIMDIFFYMLIAFSFSYLFDYQNKRLKNWIIAALVLLYPIMYMSTCGWITTSNNYIWTFSLGLYTFTAIKKINDTIKIKWYEYLFYILAAAYAANYELMNVTLSVILLFFGIYFVINKKPAVFIWILEAIALAEMIFIFTCPGNTARSGFELRYKVDYPMFSFIDKVYLGFTYTVNSVFQAKNYIFLVFCIFLCMGVFFKTKNLWHRLVSVIPLIVYLIYSYLNITSNLPYNAIEEIDASNYFLLAEYLPLVLYILLAGCILLSLFVIYELTFDMALNTVVLCVGFATRVVLGFSPTLYDTDSSRTLLFLYMALFFCILYMVYRFEKRFQSINRYVLPIGFAVPIIISVTNTLGTI